MVGYDREVQRWFDAPGPYPRANVVQAIELWRAGWATSGPMRQWGIEIHGLLAGGVELRDLGDGRANISWVVFPSFRRQGIATDAAKLASHWAINNLGVDQITASIDERNVASRATALRAEFVATGIVEPGQSEILVRYVYPAN